MLQARYIIRLQMLATVYLNLVCSLHGGEGWKNQMGTNELVLGETVSVRDEKLWILLHVMSLPSYFCCWLKVISHLILKFSLLWCLTNINLRMFLRPIYNTPLLFFQAFTRLASFSSFEWNEALCDLRWLSVTALSKGGLFMFNQEDQLPALFYSNPPLEAHSPSRSWQTERAKRLIDQSSSLAVNGLYHLICTLALCPCEWGIWD